MENVPKIIYLQIGDDCPGDVDFNELVGISWCSDRINENDIEFMLIAREGKPDSDTEANDNKHDVIKSVCPECGGKGVRPYRDHLCCYDCGNYFRKTVK